MKTNFTAAARDRGHQLYIRDVAQCVSVTVDKTTRSLAKAKKVP